MQYEVENKFPVADASEVMRRLAELGVELGPPREQVDIYFSHPGRDFGQTDEALRIRRVGDTNLVTYKGPKIDQATKTRREIELPLAADSALVEPYCELLQALGFRRVAEVRKHRRGGQLAWRQWVVEVVLDEVGAIGVFVELELVVDEELLSAAQQAILELAQQLSLGAPQRRSYLEMVLSAGDSSTAI